MKKRMWFIISSIIQIIISIYSMFNLDNFIQKGIFNDEALKSAYEILNNVENIVLIWIFLLTLVFNILILVYALKKDFEKSKWYLFAFSIGALLFSQSMISILLCIINIIFVFLFSKKKNEEIIPKEEVYTKNQGIILGILAIVCYLFIPAIMYFLPVNEIVNLVITDIILIVVMFLIFKKEILKDIQDLKNNFSKYTKLIFKNQLFIFLIYILAVVIEVMLLNGEAIQSVNQQTANSLPIIYVMFASLVMAPFVEEIVFRTSFRKFIKNKWIYVIVSALIFGYLHVIGEASLKMALILGLPYATLGGLFAYVYAKHNNMFFNIANHFLHNFIVCIIMLLS